MTLPFRYKARTAAQIAAGMWYGARGRRPPRADGDLAAALREIGLARCFFGIDGQPSSLRLPADEIDRIRADAESVCAGRIEVVGRGLVDCGNPPDWHRDPLSGRRFPGGLLDVRRDTGIDWRFCDEINLQRHLYALAQAYYLTGEARFADVAMQHVLSWLDANPPILDRYWHSALQCAMRAVAWVWLLHVLRGRRFSSPAQELVLVDAIRQHGRFIARHAEDAPRSYNHLIGEAAGLAVIGLAVPCLPEAQRWRDWGLEILARETARQFSREGGHREQAVGYHVFVLEAYLHVVLLCHANGVDLDPRIAATLERMFEFVMVIMRPDGMLPHLGDEGIRWHALSHAPLRDGRRLLSTGAVLFERPDMKWTAGRFSDDSAWLVGPPGRARFDALPGHPPSGASRLLSDSGLLVLRAGWAPLDPYLIFDVGAHSAGWAGHGHADALGVEAYAQGAPVLVDSGTFTYHDRDGWRRYFCGTRAHNTVQVDGEDQVSAGSGPFSWQGCMRARLRRCFINDGFAFADAEHDGYQRLTEPVCHRRLLFWVGAHYWLFWDLLTGVGRHRCEAFWHFPAADAALDQRTLECDVGDETIRVRILPLAHADMQAALRRGEEDPKQGWVSDLYGRKHAAPVLVHRRDGTLPLDLATLVVPSRTHPVSPLSLARVDLRVDGTPAALAEGGCVRARVDDSFVDYLLWSDRSGEKIAGDVVTDAHIACVRVDREGMAIGACAGGSTLRWRGAEVERVRGVVADWPPPKPSPVAGSLS